MKNTRLCPNCKRPIKIVSRETSIVAAKGKDYRKAYYQHRKLSKAISLKEIEQQVEKFHKKYETKNVRNRK